MIVWKKKLSSKERIFVYDNKIVLDDLRHGETVHLCRHASFVSVYYDGKYMSNVMLGSIWGPCTLIQTDYMTFEVHI